MSKIPKAMMLTSIFIFAESFKFSHAFRYDRIYIIVKSKRNRDTDKVRESNGGAVCSSNLLSPMIHVQSSNLSSAVEIQRFKTIHSSKERQQISRKKRQTTHKILNTIKQKRTRSSLSIFVRAEPNRVDSIRVKCYALSLTAHLSNRICKPKRQKRQYYYHRIVFMPKTLNYSLAVATQSLRVNVISKR